jgi:taurine transport system substrate-binding protein
LIGAAGMAAVTFSAGRRGLAATAPDTVNVGFFTETKPTMIAKGLGWFEDGVKAKISWTEMGAGAEINTAIAAGSCDFGLAIGSSSTAAGISQSLPYQLIGMVDNIGPAEEMTVRKSANIHAPADFKGKKVATPFGSTSHFRLLGFLKTNNLTQSEVTVLDMRPDAIVAAWTRGDIDAAYVWSPAKAKILATGGEVFRTYDKLDAAGYVIADLIVVRNGFAQQYPDAVVGFLRAYGKALEMWQTKPQEAADVVAKQAGVDAATAAANMKEYDFVPQKDQLSPAWLGTEGNPGKFTDVLKQTADFLVQQRSIRSAPGREAFAKGTNTSYLAKAVG